MSDRRALVFAAFFLIANASETWSADATDIAAYRQAVLGSATAGLKQVLLANPEFASKPPEEKMAQISSFAEHATECHMRAMQVYSPAFQDVAYGVVRSGGSWADSKEAFNRAIASELAAGGERKAAVGDMVNKGVQIGQECMSKAFGRSTQ